MGVEAIIGGNFVLGAVAAEVRIVNLDALTYAGNLDTLAPLHGDPRHVFVHGTTTGMRLTPERSALSWAGFPRSASTRAWQ